MLCCNVALHCVAEVIAPQCMSTACTGLVALYSIHVMVGGTRIHVMVVDSNTLSVRNIFHVDVKYQQILFRLLQSALIFALWMLRTHPRHTKAVPTRNLLPPDEITQVLLKTIPYLPQIQEEVYVCMRIETLNETDGDFHFLWSLMKIDIYLFHTASSCGVCPESKSLFATPSIYPAFHC
jgi:hypothetical protein